MTSFRADAPLRVARPTRNIAAAERFWVEGIGMHIQWRTDNTTSGGHELLMIGLPGAAWHLELVADPHAAIANPPGPEDLLVLYLAGAIPAELVNRAVSCGGTVVEPRNPYWARWGVTLRDPDGYLLVLCTRDWRPDAR
ncbi:VOC family protein [Tsukamurella paurometabola]|uniref:Glyoxalase-like domain n=1 Tax=Tsukamurella paurometabola TaxID=2061 RepID=A0A3P8KZ97_TSUPA|nr:VOC family protein [Tsukamurella paurometabola]UEA84460.1 VOC family protein [Tsukamurella paurometabola]VDR37025.1 Glyoxalase-like domain [Tsukamurella paurometabola]